MFAIVGATGKVGFSTSSVLRQAGAPVRAIVRDEAKAAALRAIGCEVAQADLQDPATLARALTGADAVQVILPPPPRAEDTVGEMQRTIESLVAALQQAHPSRVLAISDYGAHVGEGVGMPALFHRFEQRLRQLDTHKLFLRSAEHMEGWGLVIPAAIALGILPSLHHPVERTFPTVSAPDVGRIAAGLLLRPSPGTEERIVHIEGPRRYSANDVAATLSQLLGRDVTAQPLPRAEWQQSLERVLSPSAARLLVELYDAHNQGGLIDIEPNQGELRVGTTELIDALRPFVPPR